MKTYMIVLMKKGAKTIVSDTSASVRPRPFVKWVGGKAKLVPQLSQYFPKTYNDYYEPFVGGGAVYFAVDAERAYINDLNKTLINGYKHVKNDTDELIAQLRRLEKEYRSLADLEKKKEYYLKKRTEYNSTPEEDVSRVALLIFLNKTCFNGMYRENSKGGFNVPFGKHENPTICDEKNIRNVATKLKNATITCSSYKKAVTNVKKGDFIYFDPPYHPLNTTSSFTSYQAGGFTAEDQERLRDMFAELSSKGCHVMLSNSDSALIHELYAGYNINKIYAARFINATASGRGKIAELVVTNY